MILLDTNVVSELVRRAPDPVVFAYVRRLATLDVFTAAICEAEIRYGLARLPSGQRRKDLTRRINALFAEGFEGRVLAFDRACAALYGDIKSAREAAGRPIQVEDAMIAATASAYGAAIATRNLSHFSDCGVTVVDPWVAK